TGARTGDAETGIQKIFDQEKVQKEIEAQVKITQTFGQLAPKAAADFAKTRYDDLLAQAKLEDDLGRKAALQNEAKQWDEGGAYRIALHTVIGGLAGGAQGALGAGATAAAAPLLNELQDGIAKSLKEAGASDSVAKVAGQLIAGTTATGLGALASGGNVAGAALGLNVDANNRQLHPREIDLIKARAKEFAARMSSDGEPMTEAQAIKMLAENAADQVDNLDQRTPNGGSAYVNAQAKQFLQQIAQEAGSFTDPRGLQIKYFTTQTASGQQLNLDFSNTALYSETYNSKAYQDFAYANLNRNLLGDKPTPEALRTYIDRETDQNKRAMAAAMLLAGSGGAALAVKIAPRLLAAGKAFVEACASNPVACMNQMGLTAADLALGDAVPAGMGLATANVLANKLFDQARPGEIEQIAARLAKYTPDELLAINGATQFKDGSRNSAESVNALLELTNGSVAPYMPGTQVRDAIVGVGQKLYIVENASAAGPGGWAATKIYTDLNEARRDMALLPEWKNTFSQEGKINDLVIREYTVQQALPTRQGMAGPQEEYFKNATGQNVQTGQSYPGGGKQVELLIDTGRGAKDPLTGKTVWESYLKENAEYRIGDVTKTPQPVRRM
ncbi:MAG: filamentous hemagglutinin, partial [Pseudomonadota bacterium]|nr:filamentous hemagglutinin [Pseudomonadota bacterium]